MKTILFQGDSITDASRFKEIENDGDVFIPRAFGSGYANAVAARLLLAHPEKNLRMVNRGISGHRVVDLYARWKIDALNLKPDIISILIGVNDVWHEFSRQNGVEPERFEQIYDMSIYQIMNLEMSAEKREAHSINISQRTLNELVINILMSY